MSQKCQTIALEVIEKTKIIKSQTSEIEILKSKNENILKKFSRSQEEREEREREITSLRESEGRLREQIRGLETVLEEQEDSHQVGLDIYIHIYIYI